MWIDSGCWATKRGTSGETFAWPEEASPVSAEELASAREHGAPIVLVGTDPASPGAVERARTALATSGLALGTAPTSPSSIQALQDTAMENQFAQLGYIGILIAAYLHGPKGPAGLFIGDQAVARQARGGVHQDLPPALLDDIEAWCARFPRLVDDLGTDAGQLVEQAGRVGAALHGEAGRWHRP